MKKVTWTDKDGYRHISLLRDIDPDGLAQSGISCDPPFIDQLDWQAIKKEIWNLIIDRGITDLSDLSGLRNAIITPIYKRMIALYRSNEKES